MRTKPELKILFLHFLRLGISAFGGPAVHFVLMRRDWVERQKWMSEANFMNLWAATQIIPGPNSTEMAIHLGLNKGGIRGMLLAGLGFIFPSLVITSFIAWMYQQFGRLALTKDIFSAISPAVIALIIFSLVPLIKEKCKTASAFILGIIILILAWFRISELVIMLVVVLWALGSCYIKGQLNIFTSLAFPVLSHSALFFKMLKIGSVLYGSGYVLFAFLRTEFCDPGLLPLQTLSDAIAVGQITPGPVFSSAAFVGFQMGSWAGAALASAGIFLPSFVFVFLLHKILARVKPGVALQSVLDGLALCSISLIAFTCIELALPSIDQWNFWLLFICSYLFLTILKNLNPAWVFVFSSSLGLILQYLFG